MTEEWRGVTDYEDAYQVSNQGRLRRADGKHLRGSLSSKGYGRFSFSRDGRTETRSAHSVVMAAFVGPRPKGCQIDHINGVRTDNRLENLRYCTPHENAANMLERGTQVNGERHGSAKLTFDTAVAIVLDRKGGMRCRDIARKHHVPTDRVSYISRGINWPEAYAHALSTLDAKDQSND